VEILWMNREFPVDERTGEIFFRGACLPRDRPRGVCTLFRTSLRLIEIVPCVQFKPFLTSKFFADTVAAADVHRFQESIEGRPYLIEAIPVAADRWRAYIVRIPGVPTALMPFYGPTPADAARQLCDWLARAHRQAAASVVATAAADRGPGAPGVKTSGRGPLG
jgi:hypothetical protein